MSPSGSTPRAPGSRRRWGLDLARAGALALALGLHALWIASLLEAWPTGEIERRDYVVFADAGRRLLEGTLGGIYDARPRGFPFLHPPPVIVLSAPLGALAPRSAYGVLVALSIIALAASVIALRAFAPRRSEHDVVWLVLLASAPWVIALVLGQPAALLLAAWLVALALWRRERSFAAGLAWSVLLVKPQLAIAPLALSIARRDRRALAGFGAGALALLAASVAAGLARWPEWLHAIHRASGELVAGAMPLWKQHTWLAFLRSIAPAWAAEIAWLAVAIVLGGLALVRARAAGSPLRAGGVLVLATVALAPYAYFYDALLLVVPGAALWLERERYARRALVALAPVVTLTFAWQHAGFFALQRGPAVAGLLVTAWLALEVLLGPRE